MTDISGMREVVFDDKNTINIDSVIANYRFVRLDSTDNFPIGGSGKHLLRTIT